MRKLKTNKIKAESDKEINKKIDYAFFISSLSAFIGVTKLPMGYSNKDIARYLEQGKRIEFKGEILNDTFYKGIETFTLRIIKLLNKLNANNELEKIVKNKKVLEATKATISAHKLNLMLIDLKERTVNDELSNILNVIACYILIRDTINGNKDELLQAMDKNTIRYAKGLVTTYKELMASILYDMCNYKPYKKLELDKVS